MARDGSGFFNKFLNVIGLVDEPQDAGYGDRYSNGRSTQTARPSTYVPRQQNSRTADTRRRTVVQDERPSASRYGASQNVARNRYNDDINEGFTVRRQAANEIEDEFDAPKASERRAEPTRRNTVPGESVRSTNAPVPRQQGNIPMNRGTGAARTVMFSITSLEECCDVVDTIIANNIVLLTLEQLDDRMIQRVVDTLSGAAFALHATIRKASDRTYLIAPRTVEVNDPGYYGRRG